MSQASHLHCLYKFLPSSPHHIELGAENDVSVRDDDDASIINTLMI